MKIITSSLLCATAICAVPAALAAQETQRFTWEGTIELGYDSVYDSDVAGAEVSDTYATIDFSAEYRFSDRISAFAAITAESVRPLVQDRTFDDMGAYFSELGLRFHFDPVVISLGKISPAFGTAWDATPGFYGTSVAEDYEMFEAIGTTVDVDLAEAGTLSLAVFYADDTRLSDSFGTRRGRTNVTAGGAGNTGKLNNVALQWSKSFDATTVTLGARHLKAGQGDVKDETGYVAAVSHDFANGVSLLGEVAHFDGFGGTADDADYATLGASYGMGNWTYSASYTRRDVTSVGKTEFYTLGLDYTFKNDITLSSGLALLDESGIKSRSVGVAVIIPLGG